MNITLAPTLKKFPFRSEGHLNFLSRGSFADRKKSWLFRSVAAVCCGHQSHAKLVFVKHDMENDNS